METKGKISIRKLIGFLMFIITVVILYVPFSVSYKVSIASGTILNNNWWNALNWIKDNTPNCSVIATYWDPGHFITGIAERPVVFDGASQNALRTITIEGTPSDEEIVKLIGIDKYIAKKFEKDGKAYTNITTARIQDIGTTLFTDNETQAITILKRYLIPNCNNSMYYLASADLLGKSQWWTYFSTWRRESKSGTKYFYMPVGLTNSKQLTDGVVYIYAISVKEALLIYEKNETFTLYLQQGNQVAEIKKFFYFINTTGYLKEKPDAEIDGMVWLSPDKQWLVYMPKELENALFTRMFLFNGEDLKHFELVRNFGGEVKLFKVKFEPE